MTIEYLFEGINKSVRDTLYGEYGDHTEVQYQYFDAIESGDIDTANKLESQLSDFQRNALRKLRGPGTKMAAQDLERLLINDSSRIRPVFLKNIKYILTAFNKLTRTE